MKNQHPKGHKTFKKDKKSVYTVFPKVRKFQGFSGNIRRYLYYLRLSMSICPAYNVLCITAPPTPPEPNNVRR